MNTWIIDALDPLYFGDGRPIEDTAGQGRALPPPQVVAGLVRTRQGLDDAGCWVGDADSARKIPVEGPFPALLDASGAVAAWLFSRPLDALLLPDGLHRLLPLDLGSWGARFDGGDAGLAPVGLASPNPAKPERMNALWRWSELDAWLGERALPRATAAEPLGVPEPPLERRTHVAIDVSTGRALDGMLFSLAGRRMIADAGRVRHAFGLGVRTAATVTEGIAAAGGERRLVRWRPASGEPLPALPACVRESARAGAVRVILHTPGVFDGGWRPHSIFGAPAGSELVAACVGRPDVVSGWDLAARQARPTRRCAPAGSVYFLRLGGTSDERDAWADAAWLNPRADAEVDRRDGFGSVLLGSWDGRLAAPSPKRS